jgi:hypothetical protein
VLVEQLSHRSARLAGFADEWSKSAREHALCDSVGADGVQPSPQRPVESGNEQGKQPTSLDAKTSSCCLRENLLYGSAPALNRPSRTSERNTMTSCKSGIVRESASGSG